MLLLLKGSIIMRRFFPDLFLLLIAGLVAVWWATRPTTLTTTEAVGIDYAGDVSKGGVVFNAGGCASCHMTPGQTDRKKLGGGLALKTDFGTFIAPNISSHKTDGIGTWSAMDLANAMLRGVSPKGEHYYPAFPYTSYAHANIDDIGDLMAYLRSLPAVEGKTAGHDLKFPFSIRRFVGVWKAIFLNTAPIVDDPLHTQEWNRGRYLTDALGHCAECHSPRNAFGAIVQAQRYAGGPDPEGRGWVPNITAKGLATWSKADVSELLASGFTPDFDSVGSSMASVVKNMEALPKSDREAIAEYLKSLPAVEGPPKPAKK
jgi:mono/diheme cytochrome c family protein